jgi:NADPH2:quinone reductase
MRAIVVAEFGEPEVLVIEDRASLEPGDHEVVVRIRAAGVNPVDAYLRSGSQGYRRALPFTPGIDGAGEIASVGRWVDDFAVGDRVWIGESLTGTYAEECLCRVDQVHSLPAKVSFERGACLYVNYATAYRALFQRGGLRRGDTVLIHGATGGVGLAAVQWARAEGLQVWATFGSEAGRDLLKRQGITHLLDHVAPSQLSVLESQGVTFDCIVEMLANVNLEKDLDLMAQGGRVVVVGSRGSVTITPRKLMGREAEIRGMTLTGASEADRAAIYAAIEAAIQHGSIDPVIQETFPLARAPEAHRAVMEQRSHGKIVLVP